jgi:hypothetical protein
MPYRINEKIENKVLLHYVPHGIDSETFKPLSKNEPKFIEFKSRLFQNKCVGFSILYNSRNVHRKRTSNIILAYRQFCDNLTKEQANKCTLILHTEIIQEQGTNLFAVKEALCPAYNIVFSPGKLSPIDMNLLYNCADITINLSSNEGFGLSIAESIMAGTPVISTMTGGLQDSAGHTDNDGTPIEFNGDFGSNNIGKYKNHGCWVYPVWPATRMIQGSVPTPYIFDDIAKWEDAAEGMMYWYLAGNDKREKWGAEGRRWAMNEGGLNSKNMGQQFIDGMEYVFKNWSRPKKFDLYSVKDYVGNTMTDGHMGFEIPVIDKNKLLEKIGEIKL